MVAFVVQLWLGDGFMLYRLWKVWNNDKRVVVPISLGFFVNIVLGILLLSRNTSESMILIVTQSYLSRVTVVSASLSLFVMSFIVHLSCTLMISGRIFYLCRHVRRHMHGSRLNNPMTVAITLLESGTMYSVSILCLLMIYVFGNRYYTTVMNLIVPIVGIAFSLIVIRMGLGITTEMRLQVQDNRHTITRSSGPNTAATNSIMLLAQGSSTNTEDPESKTTY